MSKSVSLTPRNSGKHRGHACEGILAGAISKHLPATWSFQRDLPFSFLQDTDIVLSDDRGYRAVIIICYNSDSNDEEKKIDHSSHKFYRTVDEFRTIRSILDIKPELFSPDFCVITVIFGTIRGWKRRLLSELDIQCPGTLFLPDIFGEDVIESNIDAVMQVYSESDGGRLTPVQRVFDHVSNKQGSFFKGLRESVFAALKDKEVVKGLRASLPYAIRTSEADIPPVFQSRARQGLTFAANLSENELEAYLSLGGIFKEEECNVAHQSALRNLRYMDVISIHPQSRANGERIIRMFPRRPIDDQGKIVAHRPDFTDWQRMGFENAIRCLRLHRSLPELNSSYKSGIRDIQYGRLTDYGESALIGVQKLASALGMRSSAGAAKLIKESDFLICHGKASWAKGFLFVRSIAIAVSATIAKDRGLFRYFQFRSDEPSERDAEAIDYLFQNKSIAISLVNDGLNFIRDLLYEMPWKYPAETPALFSLDNSCSWNSANYLAASTNPSHNPLAAFILPWLKQKIPDKIDGYPNKRGSRVSDYFGNVRTEWTFSGHAPDGSVIFCEPRSITENHISDKSKEIRHRIGEVRDSATSASSRAITIGVLDGDFVEVESLRKVSGEHGYDMIYRIWDIIHESSN